MKIVGATTTMALCASCATASFASITPELQAVSSAKMRCPADSITVVERQASPGDTRPMLHWRADGCGRQYDCSGNRMATECAETASSEEQSLESLVVDRLALETGCAAANISVVSRASWTTGRERAYRLTACGRAYVCNAAPGLPATCKAALGS